jgi:hypothetical protein
VSEASACVEENLGKRLHHHVSLSIDRDGGTITIGRSNNLETATRGTEKRLIASILVVDVADRVPAVVNTLGGPAATAAQGSNRAADPQQRPSGCFSREQGFSGNFVGVTDAMGVRGAAALLGDAKVRSCG